MIRNHAITFRLKRKRYFLKSLLRGFLLATQWNTIPGKMLIRKGELHRLVVYTDRATIAQEVTDKLDLLLSLLDVSIQHEESR